MRGVHRPARLAGLARTGLVKPDRPGSRRCAEAFSLAFLLLGGRRAANGYLDKAHPSLACNPRQRADASALGLIEVARLIRRDALNHMSAGPQA